MTILTQELTYSILAFVFIAILTVIVVIRNKRKNSSAKLFNTIIKQHARAEIKNFIIPDGIGGLIEIEHLVLLDQGLLLIETYPISGNLFGADKIDQWTQIIDGRSYKFANPLRHVRTSRQAIKSLVPNIPIFCRIVFTSDSVFPKGMPDEVSILKTLEQDLHPILKEPLAVTRAQAAWDRLLRIARKDGQAVQREEGIDG